MIGIRRSARLRQEFAPHRSAIQMLLPSLSIADRAGGAPRPPFGQLEVVLDRAVRIRQVVDRRRRGLRNRARARRCSTAATAVPTAIPIWSVYDITPASTLPP